MKEIHPDTCILRRVLPSEMGPSTLDECEPYLIAVKVSVGRNDQALDVSWLMGAKAGAKQDFGLGYGRDTLGCNEEGSRYVPGSGRVRARPK
ncbi:unnamed protein product [Dovyalis caffra]|uniref:Uncharacterized protein n=1 Tax=Dovyalis caffra TaxID=77055 RepID=A0AAV1S7C4_9ROSI|nr:unnamed protein product [Dovyalis caffra]